MFSSTCSCNPRDARNPNGDCPHPSSHCGRGQSPSILSLNLASESTLPHWCTLFLPTVYALAPVGARISFAAKLTRFAAKSYHIWRQIYGIMAANLYRTREPTRRARATKPQKRRKPADYAGNPLTFRPRREIPCRPHQPQIHAVG